MQNQFSVKTLILFAILCFLLSGCSGLFTKAYGIKSLKPIDEKTVLKYCKKYEVPIEDCFVLDSTYLIDLFELDTLKYAAQIKNHYQPLQALYYDSEGQLQSFHVNCYAGGFPNLNWERDSIFETFIPKVETPLDSIMPLEKHLNYLIPLSETTNMSFVGFDYLVIVYWNRFMGRQSKRLIKVVQKNAELAGNEKVRIVYVNTDDAFLKEY